MESIIFQIGTLSYSKDELERIKPVFEPKKVSKKEETKARDIAEKEAKWFLEASSSEFSSQVQAIAYSQNLGEVQVISEDNEATTLNAFWELLRNNIGANVISYNLGTKLIPYLVRRSWKNGVIIPNIFNGKYLSYQYQDIAQVFACGTMEKVSLQNIANFFEIPIMYGEEKACEISTFSNKWIINQDSAIEYLRNDVKVLNSIALAMNIVEEDLFL